MSEAVELAKTARTYLSSALAALQSAPDVPAELLDLAEPIAETMGILHKVERTQGTTLERCDVALDHVRTALDKLQRIQTSHAAMDIVTESIAGALSRVHRLSRLAAAGPAQVQAAQAALASTQPVLPSPVAAPQPAPVQPAPVQPAPAPVYVPPPQVQPQYAQPQPPPQVQPQYAQPQPQYAPPPQAQPPQAQPQYAPPPPQAQPPYAPPPQAQPQWGPPPPPYAPPQPPQGFAQPFNTTQPSPGQQVAAAQAQGRPTPMPYVHPQAPQGSLPLPPQRNDPAPAAGGASIEVELGTHSPSNFYKGLAGNDVLEHGGIFVATYKIPRLGAQVRLRVLMPGDYEFTAAAVVQWTREASGGEGAEPGFGARITQISPEGRQLVYRYARNREPLFYDDL